MASLSENQTLLKKKLAEMFQFDQADLDFGIYRIMNYKRDEVKKFLEDELMTQITVQLQELGKHSKAEEIQKIDQQIESAKSMPLDEETIMSTIVKLEEKKKQLGESVDLTAIESDIYSHLAEFFSRYYDEGDFISQRRYKDGVYAIPYEGEEVKLHWANADQYYIKTTEYFNNFTFTTAYGDTVHFRLDEAETEKDNNKGKKRFFQLNEELPFEIIDDELVIHFVYKPGEKTKQEQYNAETVQAFTREISRFQAFQSIATVKDGKTELERQLNRYTARNTYDYFIHKNLEKFLSRELDFYIKNEVIFLDDLDEQDDHKTKSYLLKAKIIRNLAKKIISFLAQIEEFQKKLWLKKKFVVETNYCITLDRVPENMYPQIIANAAQLQEWVKLFAIDEIESKDGNLAEEAIIGYSDPLTIEFIKQNPYLVLDTTFFDVDFKESLIEAIDGLDDSLEGLLVHSENFQALNLLKGKYSDKLKCCYIDPPYNTNATEIIYKNGYRSSSWLSLMSNRLEIGRELLSDKGIQCVTIDDVEMKGLSSLIESIYGEDNIMGTVVIKNNPSGRSTQKGMSIAHEYGIFTSNTKNGFIGRLQRSEEQNDRYNEQDSKGSFEWVNFRKHGGLKIDSPSMFYPIFIDTKKRKMRLPMMEWNEVKKEWMLLEEPKINEIISLPIDENFVERRWKWGVDRFTSSADEFTIKNDRNGKPAVYLKARLNEEGILPLTWWDKKEYSATAYGTNMLKSIFGETSIFSYPKSLYAVIDCLKVCDFSKDDIVIDYFAGSGTTGHATIKMNREDNGRRKYILVEMGEYFNTATKPRIQKVIYSKDWKDGKPVSRNGSSHAFKYIRLESYEDALNNIKIDEEASDFFSSTPVREQYMLQYMLNQETINSPSLLNLEQLSHPFDYVMEITRNQVTEPATIDLVETFNYLIGLNVERSYGKQGYDADFSTGEHGIVTATLKPGNTYQLKMLEGITTDKYKTLVIWRNLTGDTVKDNAVLDEFFRRKKIKTTDFEYHRIYVNGDNNLPNLRSNEEDWKVVLIEEEMKKRMFAEESM